MITSSDLEIILVYYIKVVDAVLNSICLLCSPTSSLDLIQYGSITTRKLSQNLITKLSVSLPLPMHLMFDSWLKYLPVVSFILLLQTIFLSYQYCFKFLLLFFLLRKGSPTPGLMDHGAFGTGLHKWQLSACTHAQFHLYEWQVLAPAPHMELFPLLPSRSTKPERLGTSVLGY